MGLSGRSLVVSSAAERVITLNTEPGSKGTLKAWFMRGFVLWPRSTGTLGVKGRVTGHCQNIAGIRFHHHDAAGVRVVGDDGGGDFTLGDKLQALIKR
jgi:hypothetical protein